MTNPLVPLLSPPRVAVHPFPPDDECCNAMPLCPIAFSFPSRLLVPHLFLYVLWGLERPMEYEQCICYLLRYWEWPDGVRSPMLPDGKAEPHYQMRGSSTLLRDHITPA